MTHIKEIIKHNHLVGFEIKGHACTDIVGKDIVCASVSVLAINAINSLSQIASKPTTDTFLDGYMKFELEGEIPVFADVILESTRLGFQSIAEQYPDNIEYEEGGDR